MTLKEITSLQHPFVKLCVRLRTDKIIRYQEHKILLTSEKVIEEISSSFPINALITLSDLKSKIPAKENYSVTENIMKKITGDVTPSSIAAVVDMPKSQEKKFFNNKNYILALDKISDPGNLGSLLRSSLALGFEGIFFLENCVDPFNDKCLRSARGTIFRIPFHFIKKDDLEVWIQEQKKTLLLANMSGENIFTGSFHSPLILVLSSESQGISSWKIPHKKVMIPMEKNVESLNVAVAGAILMERLKNS